MSKPHLSGRQLRSHLVLHTLVTQGAYDAQWFSFNDYCITPTTEESALTFTTPWKQPICLVYKNAVMKPLHIAIPSPPPFYSSVSLGAPNMFPRFHDLMHSPLNYRPLPPDQLPGKNDLISIDCEYIALNCEQAEILPDGHRIVRKEADLRLGRVTVLTHELEVFVDDYILCEDTVADYLTRFSGLTRDDLELKKSQHHLVELKDAYTRLGTLVDRGCIFVGHGRGGVSLE